MVRDKKHIPGLAVNYSERLDGAVRGTGKVQRRGNGASMSLPQVPSRGQIHRVGGTHVLSLGQATIYQEAPGRTGYRVLAKRDKGT